jgi:hypothetical protein
MRAIKAGVDPKGIMNPGTLLPPINKKDSPPRIATITAESLNDWVVRPSSLSAPVESDPTLRSIVEGRSGPREAWYGQMWGQAKGLGDSAAAAVGFSGNKSGGTTPESVEDVPGGWKEEGDGA